MGETLKTDICVIGAGAAGLSVAAAAAMLQTPTVLIEKGRMGGDCLNAGCVPSKALIAAARHAAAMRAAPAFGFAPVEAKPAFNRVQAHVKEVIAAIAPQDGEARLQALGATVIRGEARFVDRRALEVGGRRVEARRFVIATGSRPVIPPIPGLDAVPYLTNETLFDMTRRPQRLVVLGAGPIGMEMAQAFARLGSEVVVVEPKTVLGREDPEAARLARIALERDGVSFRLGAEVASATGSGEDLSVALTAGGTEEALACSHILVAVGRRPALEGLGLEAAGVASNAQGIIVDKAMRTSNRRIHAIGDAVGAPYFTHRGNQQAGLVIRNALFRLPVAADDSLLPRVTYTDPEIAAVGLSEAQALERGTGVRILRWPFAENDRAQAERATDGFVKAFVDRKGRILGVTMVGRNAGELLAPWILAMANDLKIGAMTGVTLPYPTYSEASKRVASAFMMPRLRSPWLQRVLRLARSFG